MPIFLHMARTARSRLDIGLSSWKSNFANAQMEHDDTSDHLLMRSVNSTRIQSKASIHEQHTAWIAVFPSSGNTTAVSQRKLPNIAEPFPLDGLKKLQLPTSHNPNLSAEGNRTSSRYVPRRLISLPGVRTSKLAPSRQLQTAIRRLFMHPRHASPHSRCASSRGRTSLRRK